MPVPKIPPYINTSDRTFLSAISPQGQFMIIIFFQFLYFFFTDKVMASSLSGQCSVKISNYGRNIKSSLMYLNPYFLIYFSLAYGSKTTTFRPRAEAISVTVHPIAQKSTTRYFSLKFNRFVLQPNSVICFSGFYIHQSDVLIYTRYKTNRVFSHIAGICSQSINDWYSLLNYHLNIGATISGSRPS